MNTLIHIPILEMNRSTDVWGPDAAAFNPERWLQSKLPEGALELPSIAMPSFVAGPRSCIGFRFAVIE
jgi:cytochrome P450